MTCRGGQRYMKRHFVGLGVNLAQGIYLSTIPKSLGYFIFCTSYIA